MPARVLFVEHRADVGVAREAPPGTAVVALTAAAVDALERSRIAHVPIGTLVDTRALSQYEQTFNDWAVGLAGGLEDFVRPRHAEAPAGFLRDQAYFLQYAIGAVAWRTMLARRALAALEADSVLVSSGDVHPDFAAEGYAEQPWIAALRQAGHRVDSVPASRGERQASPRRAAGRARPPQLRHLAARASRKADRLRAVRHDCGDGCRVLAADPRYDWSEVFASPAGRRAVRLHSLVGHPSDGREWTRTYDSTVYTSRRPIDLGLPPLRIDPEETAMLRTLVAAWAGSVADAVSLEGLDLLPALLPLLTSHAEAGPALTRHADALALRALEVVRPEAVCFWAMPWLAAARLAGRSRDHGIPVLCYQHGGSYGTHTLAKELHELRLPDEFFTYGEGIARLAAPPDSPLARFVPVGSTRIEAMRVRATRRPPSAGNSVLWISEFPSQNIVGAWFAVEDTERYELERRCLTLLAPRAQVTYRAFPGQWEALGVADWLTRSRLPIRIDDRTPLERLIRRADVVVTDASSSTIWNETLALDVPLILYCDPRQTPLGDAFAADLEVACRWCRTPDELTEVVRRLAEEPQELLAELRERDAQRFLERYVLHRDDGRCVERALDALAGAVGVARPSR